MRERTRDTERERGECVKEIEVCVRERESKRDRERCVWETETERGDMIDSSISP